MLGQRVLVKLWKQRTMFSIHLTWHYFLLTITGNVWFILEIGVHIRLVIIEIWIHHIYRRIDLPSGSASFSQNTPCSV